MNDLLLEYLLKNLEISFLDEFGAGITTEDELTKKLICQDEEGNNYSKM